MSGPQASVAVVSRGRPVRLRWMLNAFAEQTIDPDQFEVIVARDDADQDTRRVLETHILRATGGLREVAFPAHSLTRGAGRNAAWRVARAPLVLFTDDDCRPAVDWVARALTAADEHPGAILQGRTLPDPDEDATLFGAPWALSHVILPVTPWAQTCNIVYTRDLLERLGGFDEQMRVGEDADLAARARRAGAVIVGAPQLLAFHAVEDHFLLGAIGSQGRSRDLAVLVKRNPELRRSLLLGVWWKPEHAAFAAALCGLAARRRGRWAMGLSVPWIALSMRHRGRDARGVVRAISELPGHAAICAAEIAVLASGSLRERTLIL